MRVAERSRQIAQPDRVVHAEGPILQVESGPVLQGQARTGPRQFLDQSLCPLSVTQPALALQAGNVRRVDGNDRRGQRRRPERNPFDNPGEVQPAGQRQHGRVQAQDRKTVPLLELEQPARSGKECLRSEDQLQAVHVELAPQAEDGLQPPVIERSGRDGKPVWAKGHGWPFRTGARAVRPGC